MMKANQVGFGFGLGFEFGFGFGLRFGFGLGFGFIELAEKIRRIQLDKSPDEIQVGLNFSAV